MISWPWQDSRATRWPTIPTLFRLKATAETESRALSEPLTLVRRIGLVLLGLQFVALLAWTTLLYHRFAETNDYAEYAQVWYMISHGNLNPHSIYGYQFWQDHFDLLVWPMSLFDLVWPHLLWLNWIQVSCVVGAESVAFIWLCEIARNRLPGSREAAWLAGVGLVLFIADPWIWETISYDFHSEPVAVLFVVLLARDLAKGKRVAWVWALLLLLSGDVAITYLVGVGLGAALAAKKWQHRGVAMVILGLSAMVLITLIHGNLGSGGVGFQTFDYLAVSSQSTKNLGLIGLVTGVAEHPLRVLDAFWAKRAAIWSALAPAGLLGILCVPLLPLFVIMIATNALFPGPEGVVPGFQSIVLYVLMPVGTVGVLGYVWRRHALVARVLASLVVVQALGWAVVWGSQMQGQWLRVSASTAKTLASIQAQIPASAEVVVSSGIMGEFSTRADVVRLDDPGTIPVTGQTWFIITPEAGIESLTTDSAMALVGELAGPLHAHLVTSANGVWAFRLQPPAGMHTVTVPGGYNHFVPLPAWTATATAGRRVMAGPVSGWHMTSTGGRGYVADGLAWQEPLGQYQAEVTLSASGPVNVEVWNDTNFKHDVLLARRSVPASGEPEIVALPVDVNTAFSPSGLANWGPFRAEWWGAPPGQRVELRVWSPGDESVNVYSADLTSAPGGGATR